MSKKLEKNGLFESSRMMLPEHKETYLEHQRRIVKRQRPVLDGQETERMSRLIAESMLAGTPVELVLFTGDAERRVAGRVMRIDQQLGRLRLAGDAFDDWVAMGDIVRVAGE